MVPGSPGSMSPSALLLQKILISGGLLVSYISFFGIVQSPGRCHHQQAGGEQDAEGDDDRLVPGVQGDAGAVLLLRLITILEVRMRTSPSLAGGSG